MAESSQPQAEDVRRYYDDNTRLLISLGHSAEGSIHRAIWGPGVSSRLQALAYVNSLLAKELAALDLSHEERDAPRVLDLGCGVCSSLCQLARKMPMVGLGVTLSSVQTQLAQERIQHLGLAQSVTCEQGDFCNLGQHITGYDLAFSIEAFVHAPDPSAYFKHSANAVRPGGVLVVCDDFRTTESNADAERWRARFQKGWVAPSLLSVTQVEQLAMQAGFRLESRNDLTTYLELARPRDYAIAALMRTLGWLPVKSQYWSMLYGGHALQVCLLKRWITHEFLVFRRNNDAQT